MQDFPQKPWYSPEEVSKYFDNITADTIRELCRTNKIQGVRKVGRKWFIPRSYLFPDTHATDTEKKP